MTLLSRSITLTPFPSFLSPKSTSPRTLIYCNNDDKSKVPRRKPMNSPRRKPSYGASRRSVLKKSFTQEQVDFTVPISTDPVVGIIGGGMSGLLCALYLQKRGIKSTVFDTGIHGLGGRMGTRIVGPEALTFDHAAQFFTVSDPNFAEMVDLWSKNGLVRQWDGAIGELQSGGNFNALPPSPPRYIGVNGMRPLAESIISETSMMNVVRPCWVSKLEPYNGKWYLSENGKPCGHFDVIVIAHNGKCANRLLASSGLPLIARQMKRLDLSSIWALLAAFEDPLPVPSTASGIPLEGAFVEGIDSLSWMANNTTKLFGSQTSRPHCWTFFSTAAFGKQNKVPQESIPSSTAEKVKKAMLEGVQLALGLPENSLKSPFYSRLQLWGAALPTNSPGIPCIFDPRGRAGICGDWLLGSSLEAAALSGMALANHIADYCQSGGTSPDEFALGLHDEFQPLKGHDIGQFPGLGSEKQINKANELQLTT
ncbi:renalase [Salvia hispanica]|uniref:renalase n=1 Tax=Salvia hispanica TaxID=49212 RepID=UPI002009D52B|nr:renalase [Salvia hispanica]XP_047943618.1 renalase [Salvia hispanica]XP_047943619.1 renalase [Salvia hispanica]XP_047943620.1 renalase [Salvia hispanica]XP_047943621.1 renalase [Salvia hispanica]XP_047943622.1 renalase [Salvia hispanica]